jgi:signal peptidase
MNTRDVSQLTFTISFTDGSAYLDTPQTAKQHRSIIGIISNILFYIVIVIVIFAIILSRGSGEEPRSLFGYSIFTVLTSSMQSEIPQYSFIITHEVKPDTLKIGDDITYLMPDGRTITHRIIGIYINYQNSGEIGFETKGVSNSSADAEIVYGKNVVGKVIFHNLQIGKGIRYISLYWMYLMIPMLAVIIGLYIISRMYGRKKSTVLPLLTSAKTRIQNIWKHETV